MIESKKQLLAFGKFGLSLAMISIIIIVGIAYFTPELLVFFDNDTLLTSNFYANVAIRLYAGFLVSSVFTLGVQFLLWLLAKGIIINQEQYIEYLDVVKTIRKYVLLLSFYFLKM